MMRFDTELPGFTGLYREMAGYSKSHGTDDRRIKYEKPRIGVLWI
jgi:hypothetical protein